MPKEHERLTEREWRDLPVTFGTKDASKALSCNERWLMRNAPKFGAVKIAGRWTFSKSRIGALLGIEESMTAGA